MIKCRHLLCNWIGIEMHYSEEEETETFELSQCNYCKRKILDWRICIQCSFHFCFDCIRWTAVQLSSPELKGTIEMKGHFCANCEEDNNRAGEQET